MIIMELNIKHQSDLLKNNYVYGSKEIYNNDIVDTICQVIVVCSKKKDLPNESDSIIILLSNPKAMHILPPSFLQMLAF